MAMAMALMAVATAHTGGTVGARCGALGRVERGGGPPVQLGGGFAIRANVRSGERPRGAHQTVVEVSHLWGVRFRV